MGQTIKYLNCWGLLLVLVFTIDSCTSKIEFTDYIKVNEPLDLMINPMDSNQRLDNIKHLIITTDSDKHKEFIKWTERNLEGWTSSPATYLPTIVLDQNNFRLIYYPTNGGVVISFIDKQNQPRQYTKEVRPGELDFLLK